MIDEGILDPIKVADRSRDYLAAVCLDQLEFLLIYTVYLFFASPLIQFSYLASCSCLVGIFWLFCVGSSLSAWGLVTIVVVVVLLV